MPNFVPESLRISLRTSHTVTYKYRSKSLVYIKPNDIFAYDPISLPTIKLLFSSSQVLCFCDETRFVTKIFVPVFHLILPQFPKTNLRQSTLQKFACDLNTLSPQACHPSSSSWKQSFLQMNVPLFKKILPQLKKSIDNYWPLKKFAFGNVTLSSHSAIFPSCGKLCVEASILTNTFVLLLIHYFRW